MILIRLITPPPSQLTIVIAMYQSDKELQTLFQSLILYRGWHSSHPYEIVKMDSNTQCIK